MFGIFKSLNPYTVIEIQVHYQSEGVIIINICLAFALRSSISALFVALLPRLDGISVEWRSECA